MNLLIIQARMGSTRLPGKVLYPLATDGTTVLEHLLQRVAQCKHVDRVVVATTDSPLDDPIADLCLRWATCSHRGPEEDVLTRYVQAAKRFGAHEESCIIRITADCPFTDPQLIDDAILTFHRTNSRYLSNTSARTFPKGFDFELFPFSALVEADDHIIDEPCAAREHVTPMIRTYQGYPRDLVKNSHNVSYVTPCGGDYSNLRCTLDTPEDYVQLRRALRRMTDPIGYTWRELTYAMEEVRS